MLSRSYMDPGLDSTRLESSRDESSRNESTRWPFFSRISLPLSPLSPFSSEPCAHTPVPRHGLSARDFLLFAARRAERRETMAVFAAKLKPPTDFSYFVDEPSLRSWLSCAKSPLGVSRFISASRVYSSCIRASI